MIIQLLINSQQQQQALVPYQQGALSDAVQQVLKKVAAKSDEKYLNKNVLFVLHIYDNINIREELLRDWMVGVKSWKMYFP